MQRLRHRAMKPLVLHRFLRLQCIGACLLLCAGGYAQAEDIDVVRVLCDDKQGTLHIEHGLIGGDDDYDKSRTFVLDVEPSDTAYQLPPARFKCRLSRQTFVVTIHRTPARGRGVCGEQEESFVQVMRGKTRITEALPVGITCGGPSVASLTIRRERSGLDVCAYPKGYGFGARVCKTHDRRHSVSRQWLSETFSPPEN
ncbi:MAG: hypothetical protein QM776_16795 [Rhodocyclaceae bacterium]